VKLSELREPGRARTMAVAGLVAIVFIVAVALFLKSYHDSGPTASASVPSDSGTPAALPSDTFSNPVTSPTAGFFPSGRITSLPEITISGIEGGGLKFAPGSIHHLVATVHSSAPIGIVGYLIPTSQDHSYGESKNVGTTWTLSTTVYGRPAYAMLFLQAGRSGAPITCEITVDGHTSAHASTSGPYGRQYCLG